MPITLRNPNNPNTDVVILNAMAIAMLTDVHGVANTRLAIVDGGTGSNQVYVQQRGKLLEAGRIFPLAHLTSGLQHYTRVFGIGYEGTLETVLDYYDRWDAVNQSIDDVRAAIAADLERLKANIEDNDALTVGQTIHSMNTIDIKLSPYEGVERVYFGTTLLVRQMRMVHNLLPYDV